MTCFIDASITPPVVTAGCVQTKLDAAQLNVGRGNHYLLLARALTRAGDTYAADERMATAEAGLHPLGPVTQLKAGTVRPGGWSHSDHCAPATRRTRSRARDRCRYGFPFFTVNCLSKNGATLMVLSLKPSGVLLKLISTAGLAE